MGGYKPALALVAGWRDTDAGGAPDPGAIVCGQHGASARVARPWVAGRTGSAGILCGHACTSTNPPSWVLERPTRCSTKNPEGAAARLQLASGEGLQLQLESSLYKAR
jgi:hypothetical protein